MHPLPNAVFLTVSPFCLNNKLLKNNALWQKIGSLPEQELFCIKSAELFFAKNEKKPEESRCIEKLIAAIRNSDFF